jgi:hypothetical protein
MNDTKIDSGIDVTTMRVLRQLPRNKQDHERGKTRGDRAFLDHADDCGPDEDGLIEEQIHLVFGGQSREERRHDAANPVRDVDRRRARAFEERHQDAATAVCAHQARLRGKAIAHLRHVADR